MHRMGSQAHACCPSNAPVQTSVSNSCCVLHHQSATLDSSADLQQPTLALLSSAEVVVAASLSRSFRDERLKPVPAQLPPLIALRI